MRLLELFAGSRSVGKVAEARGHNVFSVDNQPFENIDLVTDIGQMTINDVPFIPDVVWASPDCTTYTLAAISTHRDGIHPKTDYARFCDEVNQHFIAMVDQWLVLNPDLLFYYENPRGMMGKMPWTQRFIKHTVWYCQYKDTRAKPTHIFTNDENWQPRPQCKNSNPHCDHIRAKRGAKTGTQGLKGSYDRSKIPVELVEEILDSCEGGIYIPEQPTLFYEVAQ